MINWNCSEDRCLGSGGGEILKGMYITSADGDDGVEILGGKRMYN